MLRSDLCDYSDAYIVVKGTIDLLADDANKNDKAQETVAFKNNALFRSYFSKINSILIDIAEYLNIVMTIYNLLEYSQNYPMTSEIVRSYYVDKIDDVDDNASDHKSFEYKTQILGKTPQRPQRPPQAPLNLSGSQPPLSPWPPESPQLPVPVLNVEITIPLKYQSNVWRSLDSPLIDWNRTWFILDRRLFIVRTL